MNPPRLRHELTFRLNIWFGACLLWLVLACWPQAHAQQDSITRVTAVKLEPTKAPAAPGWNLAAEFDIQLGNKLREAVDRGLPLQFAVDFQLFRPRWYWMDEQTLATTYTYNLSYNALTRTYRLVTPANTYTSSSLDEMIDRMSRVSQWTVVQREQIAPGEKYTAQVRFRLLLTELPKPFQISALVNSEWDLSSEWVTFEFTPRREALK
ncbi:DUF4390 domain-containing protein [Limnobacter sp.]|uniref:DUF4390 domain-containing protein n=1 Tax=Limnobacter sp. TaxID=2003368 RepID=UPI003514C85B